MIEGVAKAAMRIISVNSGPMWQTVGATIVDDYHIPKNWWVLPISRMNMTLYHNIHYVLFLHLKDDDDIVSGDDDCVAIIVDNDDSDDKAVVAVDFADTI